MLTNRQHESTQLKVLDIVVLELLQGLSEVISENRRVGQQTSSDSKKVREVLPRLVNVWITDWKVNILGNEK